MAQHLGRWNLVAADQFPAEGADGGNLLRGIGLPAAGMGGQRLIFCWIAEVDELDAKGAGIEPGILVPTAASRMPGARAVRYQLIDGERCLAAVAGDQVVGAHLVLRLGQQAQGVGIVFVGVVEDQKGDPLILVGALIAGRELVLGRCAGAQQQNQWQQEEGKKTAPAPSPCCSQVAERGRSESLAHVEGSVWSVARLVSRGIWP